MEGHILFEPVAVLERRVIPRNNEPVVQWKVHWTNLPQEAATWEDANFIAWVFPQFHPWGQGSQGEGSCRTFEKSDSDLAGTRNISVIRRPWCINTSSLSQIVWATREKEGLWRSSHCPWKMVFHQHPSARNLSSYCCLSLSHLSCMSLILFYFWYLKW